ncbi:MAG: single-stranded-DNA-specific exonuclease RecJ [Lachnospiraceae bacterium]|nr:single-stranded-DNA-specific exonuclease RecJ [Lachnospiraceae bacterium]
MAQWFISAKKADFNKIARDYGIDPVVARIIRNRDIEGEEIGRYLKGGREAMYSPLLLKDMDKAVNILRDKIEAGAKIRIIGDYDADGICASYILLRGLAACGADADTVIPHRIRDGYGLNEALVEEAAAEGRDTIITCDNGIAAAPQIELAGRLGLTVIVTDHHEIPYEEDEEGNRSYLIPGAAAVVDPKQEDCPYPYKNICGSTVAYKLIQQLTEVMGNALQQGNALIQGRENPAAREKEQLLEELLEIAAFATICDVMELRDENRIIVKCGLENMHSTRNIGLKALMEVCGIDAKELSAYHIGFVLGPCMNATGRLDTAKRALELLQAGDRSRAVELAGRLKGLNDSRKELTIQGTEEAIGLIEGSSLLEDRVLVVYMPEVHESLAGIIAGRLREKYGRPAFVLTRAEGGVKGSGRSVEGYHMYEEMTLCKEYFTRYGGHRQAAGLSMEEKNIESFRRAINESCRLTREDLEEKVHIDVAMPLSYITKRLVNELELLEPFGMGNRKPVFAQKDIHILSGRILGKNRNVGKYTIADGSGRTYEMLYFGDLEAFRLFLEKRAGVYMAERLYSGERVDIALSITYYPVINSYKGRETLQIMMQHYR